MTFKILSLAFLASFTLSAHANCVFGRIEKGPDTGNWDMGYHLVVPNGGESMPLMIAGEMEVNPNERENRFENPFLKNNDVRAITFQILKGKSKGGNDYQNFAIITDIKGAVPPASVPNLSQQSFDQDICPDLAP